jgi:hypothetical protein
VPPPTVRLEEVSRTTKRSPTGDEVDWNGVRALFAGSGRQWDGAAFFPAKAPNGGPIDGATVRRHLTELEAKVIENRMVPHLPRENATS